MVSEALYDRIGPGYAVTRRTDPRLAERIWQALGDSRTVVNVGAGSGSYEPADREVVAVEPSAAMIAQRPGGAPPAVQAGAEELPFPDRSFDAALAVLSDHHWRDRLLGLRELRRVARRRVVLFNADPAEARRFWLTTEYLPGFLRLIPQRYRKPGVWTKELARELGDVRIKQVPIPHDCQDGFYGAFWRRPEAYLNPAVREGISVFALLSEVETGQALMQLRNDLDSGAWRARHAQLITLDELDLGYRIVIAELPK